MKTRTVLYADDGRVLTNGEVYGRQIFLAEGENPDNWREITDSEAEALLAEMTADGGDEGVC